MFCEECGQPIAETSEHNLDANWYHTTARTYPQLNDHQARPYVEQSI
jgi:hypothetical protein